MLKREETEEKTEQKSERKGECIVNLGIERVFIEARGSLIMGGIIMCKKKKVIIII